ncbi:MULTISPECIES: hypothetical protein [Corallococcus]|uniref:hypothetical protein n=1 Tax=Corallococcus TaxID=83461 RepID=UPI001F3D7764|nr:MULTISPECIES: hypothetical protein [Corallococcus]
MARKAQGQQGSGTQAGERPARRKTATRKTAGGAPSAGRLELRRDVAEYRAAAEAQAEIVRERINAALEVSRRTREEIEERIASELHAPRVTAKKAAAPARKRTRSSTRAAAK